MKQSLSKSLWHWTLLFQASECAKTTLKSNLRGAIDAKMNSEKFNENTRNLNNPLDDSLSSKSKEKYVVIRRSACRTGSHENGSQGQNYILIDDNITFEECWMRCDNQDNCNGFEFRSGNNNIHHYYNKKDYSRCELWTNDLKDVESNKDGFSCVYKEKNLPSSVVHDNAGLGLPRFDAYIDTACRGSNVIVGAGKIDYDVRFGLDLDSCYSSCDSDDSCRGVEYSHRTIWDRRCRIWKKKINENNQIEDVGISISFHTKRRNNFFCLMKPQHAATTITSTMLDDAINYDEDDGFGNGGCPPTELNCTNSTISWGPREVSINNVTARQPRYCPRDIRTCADGSYVTRDASDECKFRSCPSKAVDSAAQPNHIYCKKAPCHGVSSMSDVESGSMDLPCAEDFKTCTDGTRVYRDPYDECNFRSCIDNTSHTIVLDDDF